MKKIGITGSIGSGKTYVSRLFNRTIGIPVFYSDDEVKKLYLEDPYVKTEMINIFGPEAYSFGEVNTKYIANIIFNNDGYMKRVTELIKGPLLRKFYDWSYQIEFNSNEPPPFILYESAVMMDRGLFNMFDQILIVDADKEIRKKRVLGRSGLDVVKFNERDSKQLKSEEIVRILGKSMIPYKVIINEGQDLILLIKSISTIHGWKKTPLI